MHTSEEQLPIIVKYLFTFLLNFSNANVWIILCNQVCNVVPLRCNTYTCVCDTAYEMCVVYHEVGHRHLVGDLDAFLLVFH